MFGIYASWLLISGHLFAFCFIWSVTEVLVRFGFVGLVWAHRQLYKLLKLIWELLTQRFHTPPGHPEVPHSTWEPLGKKFFLTGQSKAMIQWQEKWAKNIDLYWHRMEKWTEVPLSTGLPPLINILGLIKLRLVLPQRDNPHWDQSALVIRTKLSTIWSKFWLWNDGHRKTIFDKVVTVFFRLQRKLELKRKKNLFKNSGPEEVTPIPLDQSCLITRWR